jgi:hypothetical protein
MRRVPREQTSPYALMLVGARGVCARYDNISLRTLDRWLARKVIPPQDRVINSRRYWLVESLERADRQHVVNVAAAKGATAAAE